MLLLLQPLDLRRVAVSHHRLDVSPPSSQLGTLVLATLPRLMAVREMSVAVSPSALLSSAQLILSYFPGSVDATVDEQPATKAKASTRIGGKPALEITFMSASSLQCRACYPNIEVR
ncbi:hypothetical protein [Mesorhizobium silamurunense]|uniref:hypothetical protein n=1 Tax=Mesorhizobium silamurunense TaxID=499528 RepID=UPI00177C4975